MARILATAVPKGGTGKTTTTMNLGAALAEEGQRVLLVDFDPQGNLTQALGFSPAELTFTVYDAVKAFTTDFEPQLERAIRPTQAGVDLVPATARLNLANDELATAIQREFVLQRLLEPVADRYDFILIDTLPYLGILVVNALVAANEVLIPLQPEYLAAESVLLMFNQIEMMRRSGLNPTLGVAGILLTMVDERTLIHREATQHVRDNLARHVAGQVHVPVFEAQIKRTIRFVESQARHQTILAYDPQGEATRAYRALAQEVLRGKAQG